MRRQAQRGVEVGPAGAQEAQQRWHGGGEPVEDRLVEQAGEQQVAAGAAPGGEQVEGLQGSLLGVDEGLPVEEGVEVAGGGAAGGVGVQHVLAGLDDRGGEGAVELGYRPAGLGTGFATSAAGLPHRDTPTS